MFPYFICVIIGGIPMFFLEVSLGQFMSESGIGAWKVVPLFQGKQLSSVFSTYEARVTCISLLRRCHKFSAVRLMLFAHIHTNCI